MQPAHVAAAIVGLALVGLLCYAPSVVLSLLFGMICGLAVAFVIIWLIGVIVFNDWWPFKYL